jgi:hypothetical protein
MVASWGDYTALTRYPLPAGHRIRYGKLGGFSDRSPRGGLRSLDRGREHGPIRRKRFRLIRIDRANDDDPGYSEFDETAYRTQVDHDKEFAIS